VLKSHSDVPPGIDQRAIEVTQDGGGRHDLASRPKLLFHAPIKALHSGHRLPLQAGDTAEGTAYVGSYNFRNVQEYQQWLRAVVEHISIRYHRG
jgi:hypothetical protein